MSWLIDLVRGTSPSQAVAQAVLLIGVAAACGIALGSLRVRGISLGIGGVLFAGLFIGHLLGRHDVRIDERVLNFARDFGLILFVYAIGVQVGPGFLASLRKEGLPLNLMAAAVVVLGAVLTVCVWRFGMDSGAGGKDHGDLPVAVGLLAGGTTNTPSLGAAQQVLRERVGEEAARLPGIGYAVAYPFGILGILLTMLAMRFIFRIDLQAEASALALFQERNTQRLATMNLEVHNTNLAGLPLRQIPTLADSGIVISRVMQRGHIHVAQASMELAVGDVLLAVGPPQRLEELKLIVGRESSTDLKSVPSQITTRRLIVTRSDALGKTVQELHLRERYGVTVTRVNRAEIDIAPTSNVHLQFGDTLTVVGEAPAIEQAAAEVGNSLKRLGQPQVIPVFVGIVLGVLVGSMPIPLPGVPVPVKLGLAGGPLIVAIILSRLGHIGPIVWHMPPSANFILREVGIALFLSVVGLHNGEQFFNTFAQGKGFLWLGYGALITVVPLALVALVARLWLKMNYLTLCGLLAGSMTDPPALSFAGTLTGSDAPSISYATVYPLVMLLRVIAAQGILLMFYH
jgi:putative transport protein